MSIFGSLMGKILGNNAHAPEATGSTTATTARPAPMTPTPSAPAPATATAAPPKVDVELVLETMAAGTSQKLDWRNSIVDLMKLVGIDSSLANRKALAQELGYTGDMNDSAAMNVWLHKEVMRKLAENGGHIPSDLTDCPLRACATSHRARPDFALTANMSTRLADTLERCLPAILHEWERRASAGELRSVCQSDRPGDMADVLRAICAALEPDPSEGAVDAFIAIAAAHGARRRLQGVQEGCLFEEYDFLGTAVPHALRECRIAPLTPQDLLTLEGALTTAILAGLRGYHRGEFERRGTWADALARTARDSTDLGPIPPGPGGPAANQTKFGS